MDACEERNAKLAKFARYLLLAGIGGVLVLIVAAARSERGAFNPLEVRPVNADMISAAPGCLVMTATLGTGTNFYLVDTIKQVICVYQMDGDKIRLVAAREYKHDIEIVDSSLDLGNIKSFEGSNGIDRQTSEVYAEALKKMMEQAEKNEKK